MSPLSSFRRASTSFGRITPTEFPICVSLRAAMKGSPSYNERYNTLPHGELQARRKHGGRPLPRRRPAQGTIGPCRSLFRRSRFPGARSRSARFARREQAARTSTRCPRPCTCASTSAPPRSPSTGRRGSSARAISASRATASSSSRRSSTAALSATAKRRSRVCTSSSRARQPCRGNAGRPGRPGARGRNALKARRGAGRSRSCAAGSDPPPTEGAGCHGSCAPRKAASARMRARLSPRNNPPIGNVYGSPIPTGENRGAPGGPARSISRSIASRSYESRGGARSGAARLPGGGRNPRGEERISRLGRELLQLLLLLQPFGFELRQLPHDVSLIEDKRLQRLLLRLAVARWVGELSVDRGLLRAQLRHFPFQPLDPRFDRFSRFGLALTRFRFLAFLLAVLVCRGRRGLLRFRQRRGFPFRRELGPEQPVAIVVQIAVERLQPAVGDD